MTSYLGLHVCKAVHMEGRCAPAQTVSDYLGLNVLRSTANLRVGLHVSLMKQHPGSK